MAYAAAIVVEKAALKVAKVAADAIISGTAAVAVTVAEAALKAADLALHVVSLTRCRHRWYFIGHSAIST